MSGSITRMRARLQQRNAAKATQAPADAIHQIQTAYGVREGMSVVTFAEPVRQLVMTPQQAADMIKGIMSTLDALEKGIGK